MAPTVKPPLMEEYPGSFSAVASLALDENITRNWTKQKNIEKDHTELISGQLDGASGNRHDVRREQKQAQDAGHAGRRYPRKFRQQTPEDGARPIWITVDAAIQGQTTDVGSRTRIRNGVATSLLARAVSVIDANQSARILTSPFQATCIAAAASAAKTT